MPSRLHSEESLQEKTGRFFSRRKGFAYLLFFSVSYGLTSAVRMMQGESCFSVFSQRGQVGSDRYDKPSSDGPKRKDVQSLNKSALLFQGCKRPRHLHLQPEAFDGF